jgi:hypothetical protein
VTAITEQDVRDLIEGRFVADAGEDWIIERGPDADRRFARYLTLHMTDRPGSAELDL